eukprot:6197045-Pleurochrysis_carterae.AAC.2
MEYGEALRRGFRPARHKCPASTACEPDFDKETATCTLHSLVLGIHSQQQHATTSPAVANGQCRDVAIAAARGCMSV